MGVSVRRGLIKSSQLKTSAKKHEMDGDIKDILDIDRDQQTPQLCKETLMGSVKVHTSTINAVWIIQLLIRWAMLGNAIYAISLNNLKHERQNYTFCEYVVLYDFLGIHR